MKKQVSVLIFMAIVFCLMIFTDDFKVTLPPIVAIGLALLTHEVILSLFCGIWIGAIIKLGFNDFTGFFESLFYGFFRTTDTYVLEGLTNPGHVIIILFTLFIGGLVGVITRSGGLIGMVDKLARYTNSATKAQLMTWLMGFVIFFDGYTNTLIVGNTMRPITDKFKISREKLSYIVDSTAAPITSLAFISTWIGYEVGLIGDVLKRTSFEVDPYMAFIYSLPYRFYATILLVGIPIFILMRRDFSSMLRAERRVLLTGDLVEEGSTPCAGEEITGLTTPDLKFCKWYNAIIPILLLIVGTLAGLFITGYNSLVESNMAEITLKGVISKADSLKSLLWSSLFSGLITIIILRLQKITRLNNIIASWISGAKSMVTAIIILSLAWGMGAITKELDTASYICKLFSDKLPLFTLPTLVFLVASVISFATGTSWGTMAILFPIAVPLVEAISITQGVYGMEAYQTLYITIGSVLTGATFGDHCSPISDTSIMSSMASQVDHVDHIKTQLPYALTFAGISCVLGYLPAGFGINPFLLMGIQLIVLVGIIRWLGEKI